MNFRAIPSLLMAVALLAAGCAGLVFEPIPGTPPSSPQSPQSPQAPPPSAPMPPAPGKSGASGGGGRRTPPASPGGASVPGAPQQTPAPRVPKSPTVPAPTPTPSPTQSGTGGAIADALRRQRVADRIPLTDSGKTIVEFQTRATLPPGVPEAYRRGGYITSITTPSGRRISDDFPPKHQHHHGVWAAWTKTAFEGRQPDFWNMGALKGRVEFMGVDQVTQNRLRSRHRYVDMTVQPEKSALEELFEVQVRPSTVGNRPAHVFDVSLTQTCVTGSPLQLPTYHYGGIAFRGARQWDGATQCQVLTSEGIADRVKADATKARWCYIGGLVDGQTAGIAVLCHPQNFRAPQPLRVHPDEPYLCFAPQRSGDFAIQPGQPYVARYRFVAFDGPPDRAWLDQAWQQYSNGR